MTKAVFNLRETIRSIENKPEYAEIYPLLSPILKRRIRLVTEAVKLVVQVRELIQDTYPDNAIARNLLLRKVDDELKAFSAWTPKAPAATQPAQEAVTAKAVEPPATDVTVQSEAVVEAFEPRKVANEILTLRKSHPKSVLLIGAFADHVRQSKPVTPLADVERYLHQWLALADTTIKNDVPLLVDVKSKILLVCEAYSTYYKQNEKAGVYV